MSDLCLDQKGANCASRVDCILVAAAARRAPAVWPAPREHGPQYGDNNEEEPQNADRQGSAEGRPEDGTCRGAPRSTLHAAALEQAEKLARAHDTRDTRAILARPWMRMFVCSPLTNWDGP
eukprot:scaffold90233_cov32-Tisochrysis_lutea.AAC.1